MVGPSPGDSEPPLAVLASVDTGVARLRIVGPIDHLNAARLVTAVEESLLTAAGDGGELRLDLARCTFVDSRGLSALLAVQLRAEQAGLRFRLVNRPEFLERVLGMTGLRARFDPR